MLRKFSRETLMSWFSSLPEDAGVRHILQMNRPAGRALVAYHEAVLRQPSELTVAERELIAALVSGLNSCNYCYGVHSRTAATFGLDEATIAAMVQDLDTAPVTDKLRPVLRYALKLTLQPSRVTDRDAQDVYSAGWSEQALHDAINVTCLFNFMNRLLEGHGVHGSDRVFASRGKQLAEDGYQPLLAFLQDRITE
jgi:uncharacterized peroxidase-related enzyme